MLPEILVGLAASGGAAVVTAAGTDAWVGTRTAVARLLGRDGQREEAVLQRLDQTAADLAQASADDAQGGLEQVCVAQSRSWETRFTDLLQDLPERERDEAVRELRSLVEHVRQHGCGSGASAGPGGVAANGDMIIGATRGSVAAVVVNGDVRLDPPNPRGGPGLTAPGSSGPQRRDRSALLGRLLHMSRFGAPGDSPAPHITASHGGVAVGHADQVTYIRRQRARRWGLLVVPVVVAGGTITAITLVPDSSPSSPERSSPGWSSAAPSYSASPSPAGRPSATGSPPAPTARASASAAAVAQPVRTRATSAPEAGPPPSAQTGATALSPGSVSRLRNASTGQCVSGDASVYPAFGTCSSSDAYAWTLRSSGGGTFELVNRASGKCLSAPFNNDYAAQLETCGGVGGTGYVHWRTGSSTAAGQTLKNTETGHCLEIASPAYGGGKQVMVTTCNSDEPQQLWSNRGTA